MPIFLKNIIQWVVIIVIALIALSLVSKYVTKIPFLTNTELKTDTVKTVEVKIKTRTVRVQTPAQLIYIEVPVKQDGYRRVIDTNYVRKGGGTDSIHVEVSCDTNMRKGIVRIGESPDTVSVTARDSIIKNNTTVTIEKDPRSWLKQAWDSDISKGIIFLTGWLAGSYTKP